MLKLSPLRESPNRQGVPGRITVFRFTYLYYFHKLKSILTLAYVIRINLFSDTRSNCRHLDGCSQFDMSETDYYFLFHHYIYSFYAHQHHLYNIIVIRFIGVCWLSDASIFERSATDDCFPACTRLGYLAWTSRAFYKNGQNTFSRQISWHLLR